jgi:hypothetical protein
LSSMSAIIISPDGYASVRRLVTCLHSQTAKGDLELVFVFPRCAPSDLDDPQLRDFAATRLIWVDDMQSTAKARAAGVQAAAAPVVVMTEDHSLPEPEWAQALILAHREDWAAVGPAVKNGNPNSLLSWANLAIEYNEWLHPVVRGEIGHLPGHNSAYKRDVLLSYGEALGDWLEAESVLHWDMRARGLRLAMEPGASTRHHNFSSFFSTLSLRFTCGQQFAGMCRVRWSLARRLLYLGGAPLIPFVRLVRIVKQFLRPGRPAHLLPRLVFVCLFLLLIETAGSFVGFLVGAGDSSARIAKVDFHRENFMNRRDRQEFSS